MELLQLRYFLEVAESEHVTHSAQKLRVSQPSLTQAISRLERELGVQLFEPEGRGIRLTEAGRFYSKRIAKAVGEIDSATSELARFDEERSSIVRINVVSASNIVVDAVAEWRAQHPAAKFQIVSSETASKIEPCDIEVRMQTGKTPRRSDFAGPGAKQRLHHARRLAQHQQPLPVAMRQTGVSPHNRLRER